MASSYLAICSQRGLELLTPESSHALRFIMRRVYDRGQGDEQCGWVVIEDRDASLIQIIIEFGYPKIASTLVQLLAREIGFLPPEFDAGVRSAGGQE